MIADLNELKLELFLRLRDSKQIIWKTSKGKEIPIKDMSDEHLINTIKLLEKNNDETTEFYEALSSIGDLENL